MGNRYRTSEVAKIIGIHPNTVRLYEKYQLIPKPERQDNGYRVFTDLHVEQFKLARTALKVEVLQNGLRKKAVDIIKTSATKNFDAAICLAESYLSQIRTEQQNAEEAIEIVKQMLSSSHRIKESRYLSLTRKQTAEYLQVTIDTLRNWELNGLITIRRKQNGYRIYTDDDIMRLKVIRSLRCANYSLAAILRMLTAISHDSSVNIRKIIDTPRHDDDIISVCDKLLTSLKEAEDNALMVMSQLRKMKKQFK
ncbi:MerR family transcriptional regulator [Gottschalkia purinilytica]|uniref:MerR family transcriptional regulator n=1 Tax=Gottschalkia purinilytica TaxID=1503 RepID=A0A0L0WC99_GOTPU|nr:MerR family transcriptional regulator [Gottschalkia purinilytica]KNF09104.1 MerR family transcriptional regulator [Gottschalkia purinilytica]